MSRHLLSSVGSNVACPFSSGAASGLDSADDDPGFPTPVLITSSANPAKPLEFRHKEHFWVLTSRALPDARMFGALFPFLHLQVCVVKIVNSLLCGLRRYLDIRRSAVDYANDSILLSLSALGIVRASGARRVLPPPARPHLGRKSPPSWSSTLQHQGRFRAQAHRSLFLMTIDRD